MDAIHVFGRIFAAVFGYCLACLAASFFLAFAAGDWMPVDWLIEHTDARVYSDFYELTPYNDEAAAFIEPLARAVVALVGSSFIGMFAFVPAGLAIVAAEAFRLRSILYHVLVGGGIALAIMAATFVPASGPGRLPADWNLFLAAGFIGGLVYWLIAGRGSGIRSSDPSTPRN